MTNRSYHVTMKNGSDANEYLVRLPGEGTEEMINRSDERKSTELACRLGIDSELLYFGDDGTKIMRFISNPQYVNEEIMRREENIKKAAEIFRRLHTCGEDTGVRFDVFGMSELYEGIIRKNNVSLYDDYPEVRREVLNIKTEVDARGKTQLVPCHNDSLMGNWVLDPSGRLYLIDWEYSGMNTAMWDLSCLSIEAEYTAENDEVLLSSYYGRKAELSEKMRFTAAKIYVDYLWSLWGLTRVPFDGEFMQRYADGRYTRLKKNILEYRNLN